MLKRSVESGQAAISGHIAKAAVRAEPLAMRLPMLLCLPIVLAACSSGSDEQAAGTRDASQAREPAAIKTARQACKHLREPPKHEKFDGGISNYEACLGERTNLTHPANPQLRDLTKNTMSVSGARVFAE